jgi:DedD protein
VTDASKAQALLDGKPHAGTTAPEGRFVVQVGAFAEADKVREVRQKVERVGLKTYTQVVQTKDGSRTRIRVGPFADKAQANQVAEKIRKLDISAVILTL